MVKQHAGCTRAYEFTGATSFKIMYVVVVSFDGKIWEDIDDGRAPPADLADACLLFDNSAFEHKVKPLKCGPVPETLNLKKSLHADADSYHRHCGFVSDEP